MRRKYHHKKTSIFAHFLEYGFHLWILLFVSNLLIFYTFSIYSFGAETETPPAELSPAVSESISKAVAPTKKFNRTPQPTPQPTKKPNGPLISLSFVVPGIGSGGGTMKPSRIKRNVTVYLYATDVNSTDNKVKPLYSIKTTAEFDANEFSPSYTAFTNTQIDLGDTVKNGKYQVSFITEQSLRKLVKEKDDAIGGKVVNITRTTKAILPLQRVISGDMAPPAGNNVMDIADYNVLVACFGKTSCFNMRQADLNDDGLVDGFDYNIMAIGFRDLVALGFAPPSLPSPRPTQVSKLSELITRAPKPSPNAKLSPKPVQTKSASNPFGAILGFFFFMVLLGGAGFFVATRTPFGRAFLATHPVPFLTQKAAKKEDATPADPNVPVAEGEVATPAETPPADASAEAIAESTEISIEEVEAAKTAAVTKAPAAGEIPTAAPAATDGSIDKTYYVKNKSKNDKGTWVVLTDDAGPIDGLLPTGTIEDGFERIKGTLTEEKGKKYILITEVLPAE